MIGNISHLIRSIAPTDYDKAVDTLNSAFDADPLSLWLYPDKKKRQINNGRIFTGALKNPKQTDVIEVTDEVDAVALLTGSEKK